jgi:hypothetical protein
MINVFNDYKPYMFYKINHCIRYLRIVLFIKRKKLKKKNYNLKL